MNEAEVVEHLVAGEAARGQVGPTALGGIGGQALVGGRIAPRTANEEWRMMNAEAGGRLLQHCIFDSSQGALGCGALSDSG